MKQVRDLHREAMDYAGRAFIAKRAGEADKAQSLFLHAFKLESDAANLVADDVSNEPTRSVLFRSAATLALDCGDVRAAEQLAARGLVGNPPDDIAEELREVLEQTRFDRHLQLRGVTLDQDEFQFTIDGAVIAPGMALINVFVDRIRDVERLVLRTAERLLAQPFQERGKGTLELFVSAPRAGSFAVSMKVGRPYQLALPGMEEIMFGFSTRVVEEVLTCINLVNSNDETSLHSRFAGTDPAYYQNFIALAHKIAPDGEKINFVGFTSSVQGEERRISFNRPRNTISVVPTRPLPQGSGKSIEIRGRLRFADETGEANKIKVVPKKGRPRTIRVPPGIMSDIVKPLWGETVLVKAVAYGRVTMLQTIDAISELAEEPSSEKSTTAQVEEKPRGLFDE
ncbi:MAG: hypothetical protein WCH05_10505 [Chlorobiaceae bacterium]